MIPTTPEPVRSPARHSEGVPAGRLRWLRTELEEWQADGLLTTDQAAAVLQRYHASRTFSLTRLLWGIGACFVGVGLIWLVAANLDVLPPGLRFGLVALLWLAFLVGGEVAAAREAHRALVGALRLLAAFAVGGVVFQAAQSLQVPAYEPKLVGLWAAAALLQAYAFRATGPLLVGATGAGVWSLWQGLNGDVTFLDLTFVVTATGVVALGLAALDDSRHPRFATVWRTGGAALVLTGLFIAALPIDDDVALSGAWWHLALWVLLGACVVVVVVRGGSLALADTEVLGGLGFLALGLLLATWRAGDSIDEVTLESWAHTAVAVVGFVALAVGVAVVATLRDSGLLTALSTLALVAFTTVQSFAVFAPIIDGAWLFLLMGVVLIASGWGFDRGRRRIAADIGGPAAGATEGGAR